MLDERIERPSLLFYCQHSLGMGHLARAFLLVEALVADFRIVLINGGRFPPGTRIPHDVEVVDLPPIGMDEHKRLISFDSRHDLEAAWIERRRLILETYERTRPSVIMIELFPFGRKKFAAELMPLLKLARTGDPRAVVLCSLRDILVNSREDQQSHDDRAANIVNEYFDAVLVHADPAFARLEESFSPSIALRKPVVYTGFVAPPSNPQPIAERERRVLVSAGGGIVGGRLLQAAMHAQSILWPQEQLPMTLVGGPFLPDAQRVQLKAAALRQPGVEFVDSLPGLASRMTRVSASVSQCGYNSAMDILRAGVSSLVVPFSDNAETEQTFRAERLARLGLLRRLAPEELSGPTLANEICALMDFRPASLRLNLNGARHASQEVLRLHRARSGALA